MHFAPFFKGKKYLVPNRYCYRANDDCRFLNPLRYIETIIVKIRFLRECESYNKKRSTDISAGCCLRDCCGDRRRLLWADFFNSFKIIATIVKVFRFYHRFCFLRLIVCGFFCGRNFAVLNFAMLFVCAFESL
jgi:hypothetical protein